MTKFLMILTGLLLAGCVVAPYGGYHNGYYGERHENHFHDFHEHW